MSRQTTILVIVFIVLSFAAGLGAGLKVGGMGSGQSIKPGENTYQAGWNAAKKRLAESGFYPAVGNLEMKSISGEVVKLDGNKLTLKTRAIEPLADPSLDSRTIVIDSNTKIYMMEQRNQQEIQKEMEEFQKKMQEQMADPTAAKPLTPPESFTKKEISVSDMKAGQQITVMSGTDVREAKEIKAVEIMVQAMIAAPAMPAAQDGSGIPDTSLPPMPPTPAGPTN